MTTTPSTITYPPINKFILFGGDPVKGDAYNCDFLIATLQAWTETLGLPRLSVYGMIESDFIRIADKTSNRQNPIQLTRTEILALLARRL